MNIACALLLLVFSVFGAHALTYLFVGILPDAAVVSLGLESARPEVVAAFHAAHSARSYVDVLCDLVRLDFGTTLDGIPVSHELLTALSASAPRILLAFMVIAGLCVLTVLYGPASNQRLERLASFVAFLPPYLIPFLALLCLLTLQSSLGGRTAEALTPVAAVVAIAVVPAALNVAQTASIMRRTLRTDFARTLVAVGASPRYQRARLLNNVVAEIVPSLEKMLTSMTAALLFAEPVLGLSGFGTTAVRAVRRSDPALLMGVTLLLAFAVSLFRLAALVVRRHYGLRA